MKKLFIGILALLMGAAALADKSNAFIGSSSFEKMGRYSVGDTLPVVWDSTLATGDSITFRATGNGFWPSWGLDVNGTIRVWFRAIATAVSHKIYAGRPESEPYLIDSVRVVNNLAGATATGFVRIPRSK